MPRELKVTHLLATIHNGQQSEEARQMAAVLLRRLFTSEFLEFYKEVSFLLFLFNHFYLLSRICIYVLQTNYSLCYRQGVIAIFPQTCILLLWADWVLFQFKLQA